MRGVTNTTLTDIADAAGVTRGAVCLAFCQQDGAVYRNVAAAAAA
ncbi:TetR family transcriptional regulator [Klebsiella pneumoniae subsp. pneumoniae]|nr:TetR family transcriptional regulator [Klebsiella pneumoniae subsp. pneumoniae]